MTTGPSLDKLSACLCDASGSEALDARFRALFSLKGLAAADGARTQAVIDVIAAAFEGNDSALLKHEMAYVLGQIKDVGAMPCLEHVLADAKEHAMVRHEAAEAMGAIGSTVALPTLKRYLSDADVSVRETCELAIRKIEYEQGGGGSSKSGDMSEAEAITRAKAEADSGDNDDEDIKSAFAPIDPAPAHSTRSAELVASIATYRQQLTAGPSLPLFERYRAMFSLRNAVHAARRLEAESAGTDAVLALAAGLADGSALFRHEICFVFGELAHAACVDSMLTVLDDSAEHEMVRHEAAEALGAVVEEEEEEEEEEEGEEKDGQVKGKIMARLQRWAGDKEAPRVVRESCIVALDEMAYNNDPSQFQPVEA
ncbi:ARM repeat-containing protein [Acaromyces ingoldii]|uniref:Deoxyhypusine hydroxylase n=1 Tax=Acaromyces ingoldii TaxID=215250 RepID=A0A316YPP4_9BASI|nr:ARM repeat-containing protein [Acaromyces ingoldii]PWN89715.1 ARM repeat-containing protein [Acaromyces ingoldii]